MVSVKYCTQLQIGICQDSRFMSFIEKTLQPASCAVQLPKSGKGYSSGLVSVFNARIATG